MRLSKAILFVSVCIGSALLPLQEMNAQEHGEVNFEVACDEAVQATFDDALARLHNMIYVSARERFEEVIEEDPNCAMGYWGVATTLFQPLWGTRPSEEDLRSGKKNIDKALELVDSDKEKYLIESTAAFYKEPETAEFWTRIERWADGLERAYEKYPNDIEIASFYSLSRLTIAQRADNRDPYHDEAESILREIYEEVSTHPGAIHYSIHATDVDGRAENALDMVEAYGRIAPDNPHALHMPSHIYVRLGDWPEVINWNKASAEAALLHSVNGAVSHHYVHAKDYLVYAYLQRGEDDLIDPILDEVWSKDPHQASFVSAFHFAAIPARLAVERRDWEEAADLEPRSPEYLPWDDSRWAEGMTRLAKGLGAVHTGNVDAARDAEQKLKELRDHAKAEDAGDMADYIEIERLILAGWIAKADGNAERAVESLKSAVELESNTEKHPVSPGALLPPNEALGDLLMELDRPDEALEAYRASDAIWPERYNTLLGAARAAKEAGENMVAEEFYERLLAGTGDTNRPGIHEAQGFLAEHEQLGEN